METGKLDRRVRIERAAIVDDGYNEVRGWGTMTERWTQYIPSAGRESRELLGQSATMPATFIIRYSSDLEPLLTDTANYRVRFPASDDGEVYDIKSVVNPDRRVSIHITALASQ